MSFLLDVTIRSSAMLAAALFVLPLLRRRSAALRHSVLAGAMAASAVVLPLSWVLPVWTVQVPLAVTASSSVAAGTPAFAVAAAVDPAQPRGVPALAILVVTVWAIGAGVGAMVLAAAFGRLRRIVSRAVPLRDGPWSRCARELTAAVGLQRPIVLLQTHTPDVLATWGLIRPRILLPSHAHEWSDARIHAVLCHELAHIQRHDWLTQIGAEAIRAIYWFNPVFWLACRRLRRESELACDDVVLRLGVPAGDYALHLLEVARSCRSSAIPVAAVMPMARPSTLERRIAAMLNPNLGRQALSRRAVAVTVVGLLGLALPAAAVRVAQEAQLPLSGVVYDSSGGVMPNAALTLEDERQNRWQTTSDSTGRFEFAPVGSGRYVLAVSLPGFRPLRQELNLRATRDWARAVTLQVGDVKETITIREQRVKPQRRGPQASAPMPVRVGGNIRPPRKLRDVKPLYPASMRDAGLEGVVPLEAIIGVDGGVVSVRVVTAQVHPDLGQAAVDAVRQWRFDPTLLNGRPVEVVMTVAIEFQLED